MTVIVGIVYLTTMGFAGAQPYGQTVTVPDRALTTSESRGVFLFANRECAYCHQINGAGGHRVGPDLSNMLAKHRSEDYLMQYIKNPQSINSTSIMPKYDMADADLKSLADYLLSLKSPLKTIKREEVLAGGVK
jgi:mono/diheme cytochrome c family protein